ncbi:MAG: UDP-N-acetylmuramoyl-L-alanine--D-glutamate ligase [Myxococcota bacterium]|nr:UDP-N-acetylmuramoyl-L-alanine--D-glutamate ligase [Myxococcota bacterium]
MTYRGQRVAVWGAARSGIAVSNLLVHLGAIVHLSDTQSVSALKLDDLHPNVRVTGGGNVIGDAHTVVPSPGIPPRHRLFDDARSQGVRIASEIEVAASIANAPMIAITGTDGKTTTTEMAARAVEGAGRRPIVAGNIGTPLSARVLEATPDDVLVVEVSAFQLWSTGYFAPHAGVITNIAGDHADYFDHDLHAYAAAKLRLLRDMSPGSSAILKGDDPALAHVQRPPGVSKVTFQAAPTDDGWGYAGGWLTHAGRPIMAASELKVAGVHNICNAQAALAAGLALGLAPDGLVAGLQSFEGLPHRVERVRCRRGVWWVNDSKATNPHAAAAGLSAQMGPVIIITGGFDKGLDLAPLIDAFDTVKHVIAMGTTAPRMVAACGARWPHSVARDMADAVRLADGISETGDTIILSPAASSFDAYRSYAHRGEVFKKIVTELPE